MPIKSSPFGKVVLTGEDATRFIRHMNEDKPNPLAQASLERGRKLMEKTDIIKNRLTAVFKKQ